MTETGDSRSPRAGRVELAGVLLIALTAVLTAWSAFESSKWSGVMAIRFNEAGAARTESVRASDLADSQMVTDVGLFTNYIDALAAGETELADFYHARFPDRLGPAVGTWLETRPLRSADAPATPFDLEEYHVEAEDRAADLRDTADRRADEAREANQTSDNYTITSVFFATAILLAALSSKIDRSSLQLTLLVGAAVLLVGTAAVIATYPIEI